MRLLLCFLVVAAALLCVAAAQPTAAPVTLSFSYEQTGYQPAPAHDAGAPRDQHPMAASATAATPPQPHLAPPAVTTHPLSTSHTHQLSINDTAMRADNSSAAPAAAMARNSTTVTREDRTVVRQDGGRNGTVVERRVTERREESEKEESEKKDGDKEASFPDDNPAHNITHGNRTVLNRTSNAGSANAALGVSLVVAPLLAMASLHW